MVTLGMISLAGFTLMALKLNKICCMYFMQRPREPDIALEPSHCERNLMARCLLTVIRFGDLPHC